LLRQVANATVCGKIAPFGGSDLAEAIKSPPTECVGLG